MKIPVPVWIAYGILTIILLIMGQILLKSFGRYHEGFVLLLIWVYATGILLIIQSISLIRTRKVGRIVHGSIFLAIGIAVVLFGFLITLVSSGL